jgi:hypothetical protein
MASGLSEFAGLAQEFFDVPGEFSHGRIMTEVRGTFPNTCACGRSGPCTYSGRRARAGGVAVRCGMSEY